MLQPDDILKFGKHKGKRLRDVCEADPAYLCWLQKTGFSDLGKEITEFVFAWMEQNPEDVRRIERSIERKKKEEAAKARIADDVDVSDHADDSARYVPPPPAPTVERGASWGSW